MDRRNFLKLSAVTGATSLVGSEASAATRDPGEDWSILVDLGQCIGCRSCEVACAEANGLPEPDFEQEPTAASTAAEPVACRRPAISAGNTRSTRGTAVKKSRVSSG